jgi:hypothetical protein
MKNLIAGVQLSPNLRARCSSSSAKTHPFELNEVVLNE